MIKLTHTFLIGLIAAGLLAGCGGGDGSDDTENHEATEHVENGNDDGANNPTTPSPAPSPTPNPAPATAKTFTADVMPVLTAKCKSCHGDNGNFTVTTPSATYANISDLKSSVSAAGMYLLDKGSNSIGHGGGNVIPTHSAEYQTIQSWVNSGADFN